MDGSSVAARLRAGLDRLGASPVELVALAVLAAGSLAVLGVLWVRTPAAEIPPPDDAVAAGVVPESGTVVVHVAGAVAEPGLYELPDGARVADALAAAGGATPAAALEHVNLAREVADGEQLAVPDRAALERGDDPDAGYLPDGRVDVNRAGAATLEELPGVGPVTAERIIRHREEHGRFDHVEDLLAVPGIGERTLDNLADLVGT